MTENEISNKIIGSAIAVHQNLGPGLLESAYKECLYYKLIKSGIYVEKEKPMPLVYEEVKLECGYRFEDSLRPLHETLRPLRLRKMILNEGEN